MNRRSLIYSIGTILVTSGLSALYWPRRWEYIVIHHSAGEFGNVDFLQKVHRERQPKDPIDAIPYHYVIGNGNGLEDGKVESDWRSEYHLWGAHVSGSNIDRNVRGIGICIIGNLEKDEITTAQYSALVDLTFNLMLKYNIPVKNVTGHGNTPGEHTKCPGRNFPMAKFIRDINTKLIEHS